ncbi:7-methylguanosine phosphate-specific 5'-nucleotidase-like [Ctenocephalides felis]|uniref:7-methylguanosine phosphate-specific 5'-nucleotidase-like n=1 Tax=Ctenocephalides felis TaxID=7515 RepID=UPI000E6E29BE|nr:7-methylguanosine phosphate-specific 5'-nucleotidase-like [Ctenocephalides felis]
MRRFSTYVQVPLSSIKELRGTNIFIRHRESVEKLLNNIFRDGAKHLHVITDYDFTITKHTLDNGEPTPSSFELFKNCPSVPEDYRTMTHKFKKIYKKAELDTSLPKQLREKYMRDWWTKASNITKGFPFHEQELLDMAERYKYSLRDNVEDMFKTLHDRMIPCLIFSAGLGNTVHAMLKLIHATNKNESLLKNTEHYKLLEGRANVILMGDTLTDIEMAEGMKHNNVLKIGFIPNAIAKENLCEFVKAYDIILVDHSSMKVPNAILYLSYSPPMHHFVAKAGCNSTQIERRGEDVNNGN